MMCAWKQLLSVLPPRLRPEVDRLGKNALQELRLRLGMPPELVLSGESRWLGCCVSREDLNYCINAASRYSPWAAATTAQGYLTAPGGHRIGLCGEVVCKDGVVTGIREISSLCIRVARDFPGIAKRAADAPGSILILGAPGWGKTTLLRDLIRQIGEKQCVSVVDERGELFPEGLERGKKTDVLTGCPKSPGIDMVLRTMGPDCIAVDEITAEADARALLRAANCGDFTAGQVLPGGEGGAMSYRWFGAALVIAGCGGFGFSIASGYKREEGILRQLLRALNYMEWELQYRLTPLPELCRQAGKETRGTLREVFFNLARELEWQTSPDAASCMTAALKRSHELPRRVRGIMKQLGHTLGRFDLPGQKHGLEEVKEACRMELEALGKNRETRLRSYGTLGLCAGAALAILFL